MNRIPYATLIATIMCLIGVGIFCLTMYRGASLTIIMLDQVFYFRTRWIELVQIVFVVIAVSMAALGFMILFVGCLATGSTRHKVYRAWQSRVGGRISCAVVNFRIFFFFFILNTFFFISLWALRTFWIWCGFSCCARWSLRRSSTPSSGICARRRVSKNSKPALIYRNFVSFLFIMIFFYKKTAYFFKYIF